MEDVKEFVKKYWPYILGGVVGLYLLLRNSGGGGSSSGDGGYAAFLQAQTAAGAQNAALQLQSNMQQAQIGLEQKKLDAQIELQTAALEVQNNANYANAFNQFQMTQSAMAQSIGSSTAGIIDALNKPSMMAMESAAYENAAALQAAGVVAANSFLAQAQVVASGAETIKGAGSAMQAVTSNLGLMEGQAPKSKFEQGVGLIGRAVSAYYTGGASEAAYATSGNQQNSYPFNFGNAG